MIFFCNPINRKLDRLSDLVKKLLFRQEILMANVAELSDAVLVLSQQIDAIALLVQGLKDAQGNLIDPAALDPVLAALNDAKAKADLIK